MQHNNIITTINGKNVGFIKYKMPVTKNAIKINEFNNELKEQTNNTFNYRDYTNANNFIPNNLVNQQIKENDVTTNEQTFITNNNNVFIKMR